MGYRELFREFRAQFDGSDSWGSAMSAWFDVAEAAHLRGLSIPAHWEFKPSPMLTEPNPDSFFASEVLPDADADALIRLGNVLERYTRILKSKGEDY